MTTPPAQTSPAGPDGALRRSKKQKTAGEYPGQGDVKGDAASTGSAVVLSQADRGAHTRVTDGGLGLSSSRGYRIVRATRGVRTGAWYYEVQVARLGATGAARIGWTTAGAELQGPVGADRFGFAYRSLEGSKVHAGMREPYGAAWSEGDVIGCLISLPAIQTGKSSSYLGWVLINFSFLQGKSWDNFCLSRQSHRCNDDRTFLVLSLLRGSLDDRHILPIEFEHPLLLLLLLLRGVKTMVYASLNNMQCEEQII